MISLIPCYSLEDFSLYRKASDVDEIFSAWSALYHPALVDHFGEAPRWEAAGSPSTGKPRRLVVVPPCAEYLVSHSWIKSAEAEGAVVIRRQSDRESILAEAFERLGLDPRPRSRNSQSEKSAAERNSEKALEEKQDNGKDVDVARDDADSFLAVGLCCLMEELLTRKLRYMSNLDQVSFNTRVVEAAKAHMVGDVEGREKSLQKAFDLLAQSKEYFFPTATKFLDLTWVKDEDLERDLPAMLRRRRLRKEITNLVLPAPILKSCAQKRPDVVNLLREEIRADRVKILGGDEWEAPLYLMSPQEIARLLLAGRQEYLTTLGVAPSVFARQEAGYAQIMPQLLKAAGYKGVLARTGDGWTLLEKKTDRSQFRWQGRDGSTIAAICKLPLDATNSEEILQLPDKIGGSYYSDDASVIIFEHRPNKESKWLGDMLRMDRYSPVLGKFYDVVDYLRVTEGSGDKEKFVKDRFKTNFLTRSAKREREDLVSLWPQRRRLGLADSALSQLETVIRLLVFKVKKDSKKKIETLFQQYLDDSFELRGEINAALRRLDSYLLPVETTDPPLCDLYERLKALEERKATLLHDARRFLTLALKNTAQKRKPNFPEEFAERIGTLVVNASPVEKEFVWEIVDDSNDSHGGTYDSNKALLKAFRAALVADGSGTFRAFSDDKSAIWRFAASIQPNATLWLPALDSATCHFPSRPLFETNEGPTTFLKRDSNETNVEKEVPSKTVRNRSFLQKVASKIRGDAVNAAASSRDAQTPKSSLAEYVEYRYSPKETERFYALRNDVFEIRIDPTTGAVRRLTTLKTNATFSNGVLRQPTLGNRFAWDVALKLPEDVATRDSRDPNDPFYGYTIPAADDIAVVNSEAGIGRLRIEGRLVAPSGELAGVFKETLTARLKSQIIDVDLEIEPRTLPDSSPWNSYYACRFAWKDAFADIRGGVSATLIGTSRDYIQAPECVDIRSEDDAGITILSAGLPFFKKIGSSRMDAILIPKGETRKNFRFGVGVDLKKPHDAALAYADIPPFIVEGVPCPGKLVAQFFKVDRRNVKILEETPILVKERAEETIEKKRVNEGFAGVRIVLLETGGAETETTLRSFFPVKSVEAIDLLGKRSCEEYGVKNGVLIHLTFKPRQLRVLNLYF